MVAGPKRVYGEILNQNVRAWALCDSGSPWPMIVSHAVGRRLDLWNDATPLAPVRTPRIGFDGLGLCRLVRGPDVRLGSQVIASPLIVIRPPSAEREDVTLGLPLLRTVDLVIDG